MRSGGNASPATWRTVPIPPKVSRPEMSVWTGEQLRAFLASLASDRLSAAFLLAATSGMRRGEILGLRWSDVDLDAGRLAVRQQLVTTGYRLSFTEPKTNKGKRALDLDPATVGALRAHRSRQLEERLAWGEGYQDPGLVFTSEDGGPLHPQSFSGSFERHVRASGLPPIRLHDLRHTYATIALGAGMHPKVVSERLGHASITITLDTYSHVIPWLDKQEADRSRL
jgi:integrase